MKKDKLKTYALQAVLLIILFFALFVPNIINRRNLAILLVIYAYIVYKLIKKRDMTSIYRKQVIIIMLSAAIIYLAVYYIMGLYFGFYNASVKFGLWAIRKYILPLILITVSSEIIRNVFTAQKAKLSSTLIFVAMVLIDLIMYTSIYDIQTMEGMLAIVGYVAFASISCNLLYNYISKRFGIIPIIIYRLITILYAYIIPIIPDIYIFFKSFLRMLYPYFIYLILETLYAKPNISVASEYYKKKRIIISAVLVIIMIGIIMLISCQFKYGILVIATGSMTGTINKGDAIIYTEYTNQKIANGQIVIYEREGIWLVHRVIDIQNVNGEKRYTTKGDANPEIDRPYVLESDIVGLCNFRIPYIGFPSLWVRDIFIK